MHSAHEALVAPKRSREPLAAANNAGPKLLAARRVAWWKTAALALALLPAWLTIAGCGYHLESPRLPGNAATLSIGSIRNRTQTGEVDVRLAHQLRTLFLKHPGMQFVAPDRGEIVVDIELTQLRVVRARDLATTNINNEQFQLVGILSVYDRIHSRYYVYHQAIQSFSRLDFDSPTIETPAIRDQGLDAAILGIAEQIESAVFVSF
jgi:hypothetical protein